MTQLTELKKVEFNGKSIRVFSDGVTEWYLQKELIEAAPESVNKIKYVTRPMIKNNYPGVQVVSRDDVNDSLAFGTPRRVIISRGVLSTICKSIMKSNREASFLELFGLIAGDIPFVISPVVIPSNPKQTIQAEGQGIVQDMLGENAPEVFEIDGKKWSKVTEIATALGLKVKSCRKILERNEDFFKGNQIIQNVSNDDMMSSMNTSRKYILLDTGGMNKLLQKIDAERLCESEETKNNVMRFQTWLEKITTGVLSNDPTVMNNITAAPELPTNAFTYTPFLPLFEEMIGMSDVLVKKGLISVSQGAVVALQETAYITKVDMSKYITLIESGTRVIGLPGSSGIEQIIQKFDMQNEEMMSTMTAMSQDIASIKMLPEAKDAEIATLRAKVDDVKSIFSCFKESLALNLSSAEQNKIDKDATNIYANKGR